MNLFQCYIIIILIFFHNLFFPKFIEKKFFQKILKQMIVYLSLEKMELLMKIYALI